MEAVAEQAEGHKCCVDTGRGVVAGPIHPEPAVLRILESPQSLVRGETRSDSQGSLPTRQQWGWPGGLLPILPTEKPNTNQTASSPPSEHRSKRDCRCTTLTEVPMSLCLADLIKTKFSLPGLR